MKYKIFEKKIGTNYLNELHSFELNHEITGFCYIDNFGFVYSADVFLGKISDSNNFPIFGDENIKRRSGSNPAFNAISNIEYSKENKLLFISEHGGREYSCVDIEANYTTHIGTGFEISYIIRDLKNFPLDSKSYIKHEKKDKFYILIDSRKIYYFNGDGFKHIAGNGSCLSSIGDNALSCGLGDPSGLDLFEGKLYFLDKSTGYIKELNKNKISNLLKVENINPLNIKVNKNNLYIYSKNEIWSYSYKLKTLGKIPIYRSDREIKNIYFNEDVIYILEKENE